MKIEESQVREIEEKIAIFMKSSEGLQALKTAYEKAAVTNKMLDEAARIDPKKLQEPVTL